MFRTKILTETKVIDQGEKWILSQLGDIGHGVEISAGIHTREGSKLPTYMGKVDGQTPIATYAHMQEYGVSFPTHTIPKRPFMATSAARMEPVFIRGTVYGMGRMYRRTVSVKMMMESMGRLLKTDIKDTIWNWKLPSNAARTIKSKSRRGRRLNPLTDSQSMLNAVKYNVKYPGRKSSLISRIRGDNLKLISLGRRKAYK